MPSLTEEEIKEKIADLSIFAISVDTAVFYNYGFNFDNAVLKKLDQFKSGPIKVLLSEIVVNEVRKHIAHDAENTQRKLRKSITKQIERWRLSVDTIDFSNDLALDGDPVMVADKQVQDYLSAVGGDVVSASKGDNVSQELLRRYFAAEPPFGVKKKNEFPDGFALLSLEAVAKQRGKIILCVSPDKDWQNFAVQSEFLICVPDLNTALSYFNDSGRNTADQTMSMWRSGAATDLIEEVRDKFSSLLCHADFHPIGQSSLLFESTPINANMQRVDVENAGNPIVIDTDEDIVTFTVDVVVAVDFEAEFNFFVKDWVDKDHVFLGSEYYTEEGDLIDFQLMITVYRDINPQPKVFEIYVIESRIEVDFGHVEPFYRDSTAE